MHIQAKSHTAASPANLADFLDVLAEDVPGEGQINVEGVTGCGIETGSGIVFSLSHDQHEIGVARLRDRGYTVDENSDLYAEEIDGDPNQPGVLARIIRRAKESPEANGRPIDAVLVGAVTGQAGLFYVQVSFIDAPFFDPAN
jgi:hypothetical protein